MSSKTTPKPISPVVSKAPVKESLPDAMVIAQGTGSHICHPGIGYKLSVEVSGSTVLLPFTVPGKPGDDAIQITVCKLNANWLGRDGHTLKAWVFGSQHGTVALQPKGNGYKLNAYVGNRIIVSAS